MLISVKLTLHTATQACERLASFSRVFHTLGVVVNELSENAMTVEMINDVLTVFVMVVWSEWYGSEFSHGLHHVTNVI